MNCPTLWACIVHDSCALRSCIFHPTIVYKISFLRINLEMRYHTILSFDLDNTHNTNLKLASANKHENQRQKLQWTSYFFVSSCKECSVILPYTTAVLQYKSFLLVSTIHTIRRSQHDSLSRYRSQKQMLLGTNYSFISLCV